MGAAMKMSDMIDLACAEIPKQAFSQWSVRNRAVIPSACCAMYAACYGHDPLRAVEGEDEPYVLMDELDAFLRKEHGEGLFTEVIDPRNGEPEMLGPLIQSLNDTARWSREKIAAWLREAGF